MLSFLLFTIFSVGTEAASRKGAGAAAKGDSPSDHFVTRPDLGAPRWTIEVYDEEAIAPGYWFVAPYAKLEQDTFEDWNGPHIYDKNGSTALPEEQASTRNQHLTASSPPYVHIGSSGQRVQERRSGNMDMS